MSAVVICEGCGRAPGAREVYCAACGRELPGRALPETSDAAPPGWLVAADARGEGGLFEPLPAVPLSLADPLTPRRSWPAAPTAAAAAAATEPTETPAEPVAQESGEAHSPIAETAVLGGDAASPRDTGRGWRIRESAMPPPPLPLALRTAAELPGDAALVVGARRPPLRALYVPLLALVLLSSCGAVALLVLHVLLHR